MDMTNCPVSVVPKFFGTRASFVEENFSLDQE